MNTDTIALIGCITGVASLLINFYKILGTRMRLKIKYNHKTTIWFNKLNSYNDYRTKYQGLIDLNIVNKSSETVTIYSLKMHHIKDKINWGKYKYDKFRLKDAIYSESRYSEIECDTLSKFDVPLKLEPYSVFKGQIFIPFLPDNIKDNYWLIAVFKTTKRTKIKLIKLRHHRIKIYNEDNKTYKYE